MAVDLKYGQLEIPGIGDDEPVFVIRGRDALALPAIENYTLLADEAGVSSDILAGIDDASEAIYLWQQHNETKVPS